MLKTAGINFIRAILFENSFSARDAKARFDVSGKAEWHELWNSEDPSLLKADSKVDVYHLRCFEVDQNILDMSIAQTKDVANHG